MTTSESTNRPYPEYNEDGSPNPLRIPVTEDSEQWEKEDALSTEEMEQSGKPRYAFGD